MMIDEQELLKSNFSFEEKSVSEETITKLLCKYEVSYDDSSLLVSVENDYLILISYILHSKYDKNKPLEDDIINFITQDIPFKEFLLQDIKKRMVHATKNTTTNFFIEIESVVNLLSQAKQYPIFQDYSHYNIESISQLFRDYESLLLEYSHDNKENFELTFQYYLTLIEVFQIICTTISTDIIKKKNITAILDDLTETINMLKYTIPLDEYKIDKLNNILGQQLFYYAHIPYINVHGKDLDFVLKKYHLLYSQQTDGYTLSKNTNFGDNSDQEEKYYAIYLANSSYLLLTLLKKVKENFSLDDLFEHNEFQEILHIYQHINSNFIQKEFTDIDHFKHALITNFIFSYTQYSAKNDPFNSYHEALNNFTTLDSKFIPADIQVIHDILLFADDIEDIVYINIAQILLNNKLIKNDYYEFMKLKTLDVILYKFCNGCANEEVEKLIDETLLYVQNNKSASHLIAAFIKLYLTISLYYSLLKEEQYLQKSKKYYALFTHTNGLELIEHEYKPIDEIITCNYGKAHLLPLDTKYDFEDQDYLNYGKKIINEYLDYANLELKSHINSRISSLVYRILVDDGLEHKQINQELSQFLSYELFFGITKIHIEGFIDIPTPIIEKGFSRKVVKIFDRYSLIFDYPQSQQDIFNHIFESNQQFIEQTVNNIIMSYIKNAIIYIDQSTGLKNIHRLNKDLTLIDQDTFTFIEFHLDDIEPVNQKYGHEIGNTYFSKIIHSVSKQLQGSDVYKLSGVRFGILVCMYDNYEQILTTANNLKIQIEDDILYPKLSIGIGIADKQRVLRLASRALNESIEEKRSPVIKSQ